MNVQLLQNTEYIQKVNLAIEEEKLRCALPVYNIDSIKNIPDEDLQFTIADDLFLEVLIFKNKRINNKIFFGN